MLDEILKISFYESEVVLDRLDVVNKYVNGKVPKVFPMFNQKLTLADGNQTLWCTLYLHVSIKNETGAEMLAATIVTHVGFHFAKVLPDKCNIDPKVVRHFAMPLYQRSAEMLTNALRAMNFNGAVLPLILPPGTKFVPIP